MAQPHTYMAFVDHRFSGAARRELAGALPGCRAVPYRASGRTVLLSVETDAPDAAGRMNSCTFVDFAFRVDASLPGRDTAAVCAAVASLAEALAAGPIRLEVKSVASGLGLSAKSAEVEIGRELERNGIAVDLSSPSTIFYVVFLRDSVEIGHAPADPASRTAADAFRNLDAAGGSVSRAGYKIREAVGFFGIDMSSVGSALDIGAAPGGWTDYLLGRGARVLAVDRALLDYRKLASHGRRILVLTDVEGGRPPMPEVEGVSVAGIGDAEGFGAYDAVHVMANLRGAALGGLLSRFGSFDMLTVDVNSSPAEAASLASSLAARLRPGSPLIMTLKLTTMSIRKHMGEVVEGLSVGYSSIRFKKLPHNRLEITVFARSNR